MRIHDLFSSVLLSKAFRLASIVCNLLTCLSHWRKRTEWNSPLGSKITVSPPVWELALKGGVLWTSSGSLLPRNPPPHMDPIPFHVNNWWTQGIFQPSWPHVVASSSHPVFVNAFFKQFVTKTTIWGDLGWGRYKLPRWMESSRQQTSWKINKQTFPKSLRIAHLDSWMNDICANIIEYPTFKRNIETK